MDLFLIVRGNRGPGARAHLEDHVPGEQASIPGNHPLAVDVLDEDAHQRGLIAPNNADGQGVGGVHPGNLYACELPVRDQVMELG